jgi:kynurenine formamidase
VRCIHTGWTAIGALNMYLHGHPHLIAVAAEWLVEQCPALVGIDSLNIARTTTAFVPRIALS